MPCRPNYNLHERAGGSPKLCFAASNVRHGVGRPAIRRFKSASLMRDVGLMGRCAAKGNHAHRRTLFFFSADSICCRRFFILFSDRKVESGLRGGFVSGEALPAEHNGDIWSREATKHGANPAAKNSRFLFEDSIIPLRPRRRRAAP